MEVLLMGILRKYLWLVLPIMFFANNASADTCENDPYACAPAKLCSKTTEKINNVLYWISSEEDKHLKIARKIKLNCGAKDAMSSCQKDASECSILELCEMSVTKEVSATNWNEINPRHVKLAKSFSLDCGVSPSANSNTLTSPCDENPSACISEELCEKATYGVVGNKNWTTPQVFAEFVKEAKQRGLTCGVISISNDKTCSQDVLNCTPAELCEAATFTVNKATEWKQGKYLPFVKEAKRRNISCGVNSASNDQVKDDEKARLALKAEKKRKADEKARLALKAEKKRKADEKARLALKAEKNAENISCYLDPMKCSKKRLCDRATFKNEWRKHDSSKYYWTAAYRRGLDCKAKNPPNCGDHYFNDNGRPNECSDIELCKRAIKYNEQNLAWWNTDSKYVNLVNEAKKRDLSCGTNEALEYEKKRLADKKENLEINWERVIKAADEKIRIAIESQKKRNADDKAMLAIKTEKHSENIACYDFPMKCKKEKLCKRALHPDGNWQTGKKNKRYKTATIRRGLDCKAKYPPNCGDYTLKGNGRPNECSDVELCQWAVKYDDKNVASWNTGLSYLRLVSEAKKRNLSCFTNDVFEYEMKRIADEKIEALDELYLTNLPNKNLDASYSKCKKDSKNCTDIEICSLTTMIDYNEITWIPDWFVDPTFKEIAMSRDLTCGAGKKWVEDMNNREFRFSISYDECFAGIGLKFSMFNEVPEYGIITDTDREIKLVMKVTPESEPIVLMGKDNGNSNAQFLNFNSDFELEIGVARPSYVSIHIARMYIPFERKGIPKEGGEKYKRLAKEKDAYQILKQKGFSDMKINDKKLSINGLYNECPHM